MRNLPTLFKLQKLHFVYVCLIKFLFLLFTFLCFKPWKSCNKEVNCDDHGLTAVTNFESSCLALEFSLLLASFTFAFFLET